MESADKAVIRRCMNDRSYSGTDSILAIEDVKDVGSIESYGCLQDGCRVAYVNREYVLPEYRRRR